MGGHGIGQRAGPQLDPIIQLELRVAAQVLDGAGELTGVAFGTQRGCQLGVEHDDQTIAVEINVKEVIVIDDDSSLVERRVKPLLPKIGKRLGSAIPAVMAAARSGEVTFEDDGSVTLGGVTLAPDEVEIQATPRPGTAVADRDGLVVVLDTGLTPALRA